MEETELLCKKYNPVTISKYKIVCFISNGDRMSNNSVQSEFRNPNSPILFVDDDPLTYKIMKNQLSEWDITYAFSGEEALNLLRENKYFIVITDLNMPDMNGCMFQGM